ncbi:hypothetical protein [Brachymonas sp. J145]|uniref:hypothetical protein n=1 Tax=Brachymonas sp. J145 TaxID=3116489 RepID=UPI002E76F50D|nr:hypothetical protein [Brachymonas sp. J145]MEE1653728.1 hypothetical protein [Brachymonas sp. J145]
MISVLDPRVWLAALLALAIAAGLGYWRGDTHGADRVQTQWDMAKAAAERAAIKQQQQQAEQARAASSQYQQEQAHDKQQTRIVRETVVQYVDRPVYRDRQCLDDGLLDNINAAIAGGAADAGTTR